MKPTIILTMMLLIVSTIVMAASSENEEQTLAFGGQEQVQQNAGDVPGNNTPIIAIAVILAGLWYFKNNKGGKLK